MRRFGLVAVFVAAAVLVWIRLDPIPVRHRAPALSGATAPARQATAPEASAPAAPAASADDEALRVLQSIDLEAARAVLPDDLYWQTAAPTTDPRAHEERERAQASWTGRYEAILAGAATDEEIRAYFDHTERLSNDFVRLIEWVLEHREQSLSEQDLETLHVAKRLHVARLAEIPRRRQDALERKARRDTR